MKKVVELMDNKITNHSLANNYSSSINIQNIAYLDTRYHVPVIQIAH